MFKTASKDQQESKVQLFHHCHMIFSGTICKKKCQMKGHTDLGDNSDFEERWSGCERRPKTKAEFFSFPFFTLSDHHQGQKPAFFWLKKVCRIGSAIFIHHFIPRSRFPFDSFH